MARVLGFGFIANTNGGRDFSGKAEAIGFLVTVFKRLHRRRAGGGGN